MLTYNTQQKPLVLPEYGRAIQNMVDYCLTIEDREERNACARSIITSMANLFPQVKNSVEERMKLWDHLAIMSGFQLDIDYPVEILDATQLQTKPEAVPYDSGNVRYRHYGSILERMVKRAAEMEEGEEREALIELLANQMKKCLVLSSMDTVDDSRVFNDLLQMSRGSIRVDAEKLKLRDYKEIPQPGKKKKKK